MRIAFYGNFGAGNLGNECTLQAVLAYARQRWPGAELQCFCTEPQDVQQRHGIPGMRAMAFGEEWTWTSPANPAAAGGAASPTDAELAARKAQTQAAPVRRNILHRLARALFLRVPRELAHWLKLGRAVRRCDILIIAGTGILTDDSGALLWPYDIFRLSALAALFRVQLLFLSMGAGPIRSPLSRWFFRNALRFAQYRSYRDNDSKLYIQGIGFNAAPDPVYPDLAFGLPSVQLAAQAGARQQSKPMVGLGLKDYSSDAAGTNSYRDYLDAMASFVLWLSGQGYTVRLLIGDAQYDSQVRLDLLDKLRGRDSAAAGGVLVDPVPTVSELLRQLAECDVVISPRFHNLVLGLSLYKRVIALSDLRKVEMLLGDLGLPQYCLSIRSLDCDTLVQRFTELQNDAERLKVYIKERVDRYHEAVGQQYASVFSATVVDSQAAVSQSG
jgi:polysaccharide pyruvyl transferase WcaK-like protein